ncbi:uncharacterized protein LOC126324484 [Schistocerca gregaria]|uniref:uncharacterized protein LOC126324484 n=1 Tax=Schistocerca gregaria TaxID=7010 RepID=UPI00211E2F91|nr:uncharacterized protein LOC126324484 [Schistocerca gregaria]
MYILVVAKSISRSLTHLFIPTILSKNNYTLKDIVYSYYIVVQLADMAVIYPCIYIIRRFGLHIGFIIAALSSTLHLWTVFNVSKLSIYISAVIFGISEGFYWTSHHTCLIISSRISLQKSIKAPYGKNLSLIKICSKLGSVIGPFIGGLLLSNSYDMYLMFLSSAITISSTIPLIYFCAHLKNQLLFEYIDVRKSGESRTKSLKEHSRNSISLISCGVNKMLATTIWPFYCATSFFNSKFSIIGNWKSVTTMISILLIFFLGRITDSIHRKNLLFVGSFATACIWILRSFSTKLWHIGVSDMLYGWAASLLNIPFFADVYDRADYSELLKCVFIQELDTETGGIIAWLLAGQLFDKKFHTLKPLFLLGVLTSITQCIYT